MLTCLDPRQRGPKGSCPAMRTTDVDRLAGGVRRTVAVATPGLRAEGMR
ncbi:hypothetical protein B7C42_02944 [Nocardia cerradoensis]|uniref:Uncharacterized protein n=1 Tax=Nocardia cerradoensis TaxID=85688 RepID=A0A231H8B3_9NOCA|nr:hypothetical protein B7C42_02944 [Nocardia cerradoensis]